MRPRITFTLVFLFLTFSFSSADDYSMILFQDDFSGLRRGPFSVEVGAHTEYHYLHETAPRGNWAVSTFTWESGFTRAWRVRNLGADRIFEQTFTCKPDHHSHPMIVTGDVLWRDYKVKATFAPQSRDLQCGVVFRYLNDRSYYFFGVHGAKAVLKRVRRATAFHQPSEKVLAEAPCQWNVGEKLTATIIAGGDSIRADLGEITLKAQDGTFTMGKIGLTSDVPAFFYDVHVQVTAEENKELDKRIQAREKEESALQEKNPDMVVWKKINTTGFGVGRNLRFGDLDSDGDIDVLIGQVVHHGPKDRNSELSCLTAMTFEGEQLWQIGEPDPWKDHLTNDVAFQIHDFDGDGNNEVVYCMNLEMIVADGATGETKFKAPTPKSPNHDQWQPGQHNRFERILGDCLYFCDLRGTGRDADLIIKDRYAHLWAYTDKLEFLWKGECRTGHYPFAYDVDNDGKDELAIGYTLFDDDGTKRWSLDDTLSDHCDGVAIVQYTKGEPPILMNAASDEGIFFTDLHGNILQHHYIGHCQNPAVANFRDDLPGLETVSINFWGNQGIIHFYDADMNIIHDFEPNQYGSMCLPINWTGGTEEFFVHNPNVVEGGLFDGWGRKVVVFPDDGHPDMCNAVLDITGDCRDEIVVWNPHEIWVYTQSDNPKSGELYNPTRNPLYNTSNYQATVSLPDWSK